MKYGNRSISYFRKITHSSITTIILVIVCFVLVKAAWNINQKSKITKDRLARTQSEIIKLEERQKILNYKVSSLSTDDGVEAEMRTKYRAIRDGELIAVIVDEEKIAAAVVSIQQPSFWQKILLLFGYVE